MIYCVKKGWPSLKDLCLHGKFGRAKSFWRCATTNHVNSLATTERNKLKSLAWLPLHSISFLEIYMEYRICQVVEFDDWQTCLAGITKQPICHCPCAAYSEVPNKQVCSLRVFFPFFSTILANFYSARLSNSINKFVLPARLFQNQY